MHTRMLLLFQVPFSLTQSPASNMPLWHVPVWCLLILPQTDCSSGGCLSHETFVISMKMAFAPVSLMSYWVGTLSPSPGLQSVSLSGPPLTSIGNAERGVSRKERLEFGVPGHGRLPQPWFFMTGRKVATRGKDFKWFDGGAGHPGSQVPACVTVSRIMQERTLEEWGSWKPHARLWVSKCSKVFWHVHNVFSQKQISGFEFPLHPTASHKAHANPLYFSKDNTTVAFELGPHSYWAMVSLLSCWLKVLQTSLTSMCSLKIHLKIQLQKAVISVSALRLMVGAFPGIISLIALSLGAVEAVRCDPFIDLHTTSWSPTPGRRRMHCQAFQLSV